MGRVAGVLDDPPGFPCTPPGVDVLEGGKLTFENKVQSAFFCTDTVIASRLTSKNENLWKLSHAHAYYVFWNIVSLVGMSFFQSID